MLAAARMKRRWKSGVRKSLYGRKRCCGGAGDVKVGFGARMLVRRVAVCVVAMLAMLLLLLRKEQR